MNAVSSKVGKMIREQRKRAGISIETLALSADITPNFLGDVERGIKQPSLKTLECLLNALNLSFEEFFTFKNDIVPRKERSRAEKIMADINGFNDKDLLVVHSIVRQLIRLKKNDG